MAQPLLIERLSREHSALADMICRERGLTKTIPLAGLLLGVAPVDDERLRNLVTHPEHRVEAGRRLLEDHGDAVATNMAHLLF